MMKFVGPKDLLEELNEIAKDQREGMRKIIRNVGVPEESVEDIVDLIYEYLEKNPQEEPIESAMHISRCLLELKKELKRRRTRRGVLNML